MMRSTPANNMSLHRGVRGRHFAWLIAFVFTVFLFPTVLWAADEQDSILGRWKVFANPSGRSNTTVNHVTYYPEGRLVLELDSGATVEGTWVHVSGNEFKLTFDRTFGRSERIFRLEETFSTTGDKYKGKYRVRSFLPDGRRARNEVIGTTSGVRVPE